MLINHILRVTNRGRQNEFEVSSGVVVDRGGVRLGLQQGLKLVKFRSNIHDSPVRHALPQFAGAETELKSLIWVKSVTSL